MSSDNQNISLDEAAGRFLASLASAERGTAQAEVNKFVRWLGRERALSGLTAYEVAGYAEQLSPSDTDYSKKAELVRAFLVYAKKQGWSQTNLAAHLKFKKGKTGFSTLSRRDSAKALSLTQQGYAELEAELDALKSRRLEVIDEMRKAAADKDFRENAPLEAAREQRGHLEGRIRELEEALKQAVIIGEKREQKQKAGIGDSIILQDLDSGEKYRYTIVSPKEVDPAGGKISDVSPVGKAVVGRGEGEVVEVATPAGKMRCQIKQVC